jgi:hypothetical protein
MPLFLLLSFPSAIGFARRIPAEILYFVTIVITSNQPIVNSLLKSRKGTKIDTWKGLAGYKYKVGDIKFSNSHAHSPTQCWWKGDQIFWTRWLLIAIIILLSSSRNQCMFVGISCSLLFVAAINSINPSCRIGGEEEAEIRPTMTEICIDNGATRCAPTSSNARGTEIRPFKLLVKNQVTTHFFYKNLFPLGVYRRLGKASPN